MSASHEGSRGEPDPLSLSVYNRLAGLGEGLAPRLLEHRLGRGKEDRWRLGERLGEAGEERPDGFLIWIHAASVGELNAVMPLVSRLAVAGPGTHVLVTSGTVTSARIARERMPQGAIHQFAPLDLPSAATRFFDHWKPDLGVLVESELWPNLIRAAYRRGLPLTLVNGRLSERSAARWAWAPKAAKAVMSSFTFVAAQSDGDAERFSQLGAPNVHNTGNLKFDAPAPRADAATLKRFKAAIGPRPVLVAASTHPGEEAMIAQSFGRIRADSETRPPLLMLAPRHPDRGDEVEALMQAEGLKVARRTAGVSPQGADVFLLDTIGEMGLAYGLADIAFVGGSLVPHGGQNPLEPAKLNVPVLHGPHVRAFRDAYAALNEAGGALKVASPDALARLVVELLPDQARRQAMAVAARTVVAGGEGATNRALKLLSGLLPAGVVAA
ncbi:MAG: 3-deoxy-D-manno-octulosonic acid transferase [Pseudomonadota bacterium]